MARSLLVSPDHMPKFDFHLMRLLPSFRSAVV